MVTGFRGATLDFPITKVQIATLAITLDTCVAKMMQFGSDDLTEVVGLVTLGNFDAA